MGGLEGSQRPPPTSCGLEQGWELNGADLNIESQFSEEEGSTPRFQGRGWEERDRMPPCSQRQGPCLGVQG